MLPIPGLAYAFPLLRTMGVFPALELVSAAALVNWVVVRMADVLS